MNTFSQYKFSFRLVSTFIKCYLIMLLHGLFITNYFYINEFQILLSNDVKGNRNK